MADEDLQWKKVYESDLPNISEEIKDLVDVPAVLILTGNLGAGKTTFCRSFTDQGETASPSYSLVHEVGNLAHADLYRIESDEDVIHLEIPLYLEDKEYFLVEWGKQYLNTLKKIVPDEFHFYELEITSNEQAETDQDQPSRNYFLTKIED